MILILFREEMLVSFLREVVFLVSVVLRRSVFPRMSASSRIKESSSSVHFSFIGSMWSCSGGDREGSLSQYMIEREEFFLRKVVSFDILRCVEFVVESNGFELPNDFSTCLRYFLPLECLCILLVIISS